MDDNQEAPGQRDPDGSREDRRAIGEESEGRCGQVLQSRVDVGEEKVPEVREQEDIIGRGGAILRQAQKRKRVQGRSISPSLPRAALASKARSALSGQQCWPSAKGRSGGEQSQNGRGLIGGPSPRHWETQETAAAAPSSAANAQQQPPRAEERQVNIEECIGSVIPVRSSHSQNTSTTTAAAQVYDELDYKSKLSSLSTSLLDVINALKSANSMSISANVWSFQSQQVQLMLVVICLQYKQASQLFLLDT